MSKQESAVVVDRPDRAILIVADDDARSAVLSASRADEHGEAHGPALVRLAYDEIYAIYDAIQDRDLRAVGVVRPDDPPVAWAEAVMDDGGTATHFADGRPVIDAEGKAVAPDGWRDRPPML